MKIVIDIPKEFRLHFELDRFNESLCRLRTDIHCIAGKYEQELCDMLIEAFNNGTPLPKGHGRLIDADAIKPIKAPIAPLTPEDSVHYEWVYMKSWIDQAPTIIEADKGGEQE